MLLQVILVSREHWSLLFIANLPQGKEQYKRLKPVQGTAQDTKITTKIITKHNVTHQIQYHVKVIQN